MKKQKGKIIPSNQEILRRLDKIEEHSTFFNYFTIFVFTFSICISVVALSFAMQNYEIFIAGVLIFILAAIVFVLMIKYLLSIKK